MDGEAAGGFEALSVSFSSTSLPSFVVLSFFFFPASSVRAVAIMTPDSGPRPLLDRMRCWRGVCCERNERRGSMVLKPNALSDRSTVCRFGRVRRDWRSASSAGGISARRREVKMSAKLAI